MNEQRTSSEFVLLLDTGDALVGEEGPAAQGDGEIVVAGMNLMAYDAMAIGPLELALGASVLRDRMEQAKFPMLSANVLWRSDLTNVGEPYTILQIGAFRIGVIGLARDPNGDLEDYVLLDPAEVLAALVPEVGEQADAVVLLTNMSYRSAMELVVAVPGIDLAVTALPMQLPSTALRMPQTGTLVVTAEQPLPNHSGRRVGRLAVRVESDGGLSREVWESRSMGIELADDPFMTALLDTFREQ